LRRQPDAGIADRPTRTVSRLLLLLPLVAIPVATVGARQHVPRTHSHVAEGSGWTELMGDMDRMHAAMASIEPSGIGDVDFVRLMLPHHQCAIDMARAELLKMAEVRRVTLANGPGMTMFGPDGRHAFVCSRFMPELAVIDVASHQVVKRLSQGSHRPQSA
jgi:hypothetical protein